MVKRKCRKCSETRESTDYYACQKRKDKLSPICKFCMCESISDRYKNKEMLIHRRYSNQKASSKKRGHPEPSYSLAELIAWTQNQPIFAKLYDKWVDSGYKSQLAPSFDRINDDAGYSLDNIIITTWDDNRKKGHAARMEGRGRQGKMCCKVEQYDMEGNFIAEYKSQADAARLNGITQSSVHLACSGKFKSMCGFIWKKKA